MATLDLLVKLASRTVDQEQQGLHVINHAIAETSNRLQALKAEGVEERSRPRDPRIAGEVMQAYVLANSRRIEACQRQLESLHSQRDAQMARLADRRLELKRLEILQERKAEQKRAEAALLERRALDEIVTTRWKRDGPR